MELAKSLLQAPGQAAAAANTASAAKNTSAPATGNSLTAASAADGDLSHNTGDLAGFGALLVSQLENAQPTEHSSQTYSGEASIAAMIIAAFDTAPGLPAGLPNDPIAGFASSTDLSSVAASADTFLDPAGLPNDPIAGFASSTANLSSVAASADTFLDPAGRPIAPPATQPVLPASLLNAQNGPGTGVQVSAQQNQQLSSNLNPADPTLPIPPTQALLPAGPAGGSSGNVLPLPVPQDIALLEPDNVDAARSGPPAADQPGAPVTPLAPGGNALEQNPVTPAPASLVAQTAENNRPPAPPSGHTPALVVQDTILTAALNPAPGEAQAPAVDKQADRPSDQPSTAVLSSPLSASRHSLPDVTTRDEPPESAKSELTGNAAGSSAPAQLVIANNIAPAATAQPQPGAAGAEQALSVIKPADTLQRPPQTDPATDRSAPAPAAPAATPLAPGQNTAGAAQVAVDGQSFAQSLAQHSETLMISGAEAISSAEKAETPQGDQAVPALVNKRELAGATPQGIARSETQNPPASPPIRDITIQISQHADTGANRFQLRLDPPELGRVEVRMEISAEGKLSAVIAVERPETLDLLQRDSRALERSLMEAGLKTDSNALSFSLKGGKHDNQQANEFHQRHGGQDNQITDDWDDSLAPMNMRFASRAVNIRI